MGELYKICQQEYNRLRPKFEEFADVDLTGVRLVRTEDYLRALAEAGKLTNGLQLNLSRNACTYCSGPEYGVKFDAIVVNEPVLFSHPLDTTSPSQLNPSHVMAHELGHATHAKLDDPYQHKMKTPRTWLTFTEGFAVYLQTDCISDLGDELRHYSDEMRDALLLAHETGEFNDMVHKFSNPMVKVEGYAFYRRAVEIAGTQDIIFDIITDPPFTMDEIWNPEQYISRVMSNG